VSRLIEREPSRDTLYPVAIPGHVWLRRNKDVVILYFTAVQLKELRANAAAAILRANKHRMENG